MLFDSFAFLGLLIITLVAYYLPRLSRLQVPILIISSLVFYSYNQPVLVLLLLFSVSINIVTSYYIVFGQVKHRRMFAALGVGLNLFLLCFFKYSPLFSRIFFRETSSIGEFLLTIPLPVGISFFTFQGISLVVDVFKEKHFRSRDVIPVSFREHAQRILFFKAFFPQLISGPIVKAHEFLPQIEPKRFRDIHWETCFKSLVLGYFLKMVVADNLRPFTFWMTYPYFQSKPTVELLAMLFGYSCQIFADFAGYSLIAIGLAKLFGYDFKANFSFPYISTSFREFWKRWHISLSTFLMEYLYIPLGGNRKGRIRTYVNLMITMILGGLWHGAAWSYAVWGTFHGFALAAERLLDEKVSLPDNRWVKVSRGVLVFTLITLGWLLFKLPEFSHVISYLKTMVFHWGFGSPTPMLFIFVYSLPVVVYHALYLLRESGGARKIRDLEYLAYGCMVFLIITNSGAPGAFIYFQF
jgi:alginate O-acetyltransferase complex protein AlgI